MRAHPIGRFCTAQVAAPAAFIARFGSPGEPEKGRTLPEAGFRVPGSVGDGIDRFEEGQTNSEPIVRRWCYRLLTNRIRMVWLVESSAAKKLRAARP